VRRELPDFDFRLAYGQGREKALRELILSGNYEVKSDRKTIRTGNIVLETSQLSRDGERIPSGIEKTSANWWGYEWAPDCWLLAPAPLVKRTTRNLIHQGIFKLRPMGDNGNEGLCPPLADFVDALRREAADEWQGRRW